MLAATKRWFSRNRRPITIAVGVVGAGYVVTNYVLAKLRDARERMSSDRIAKENLRRRFEQNQEDCTFTVLALLPTATANILEAMNTEKITYEIQQLKGSAVARTRSIGSTSPPSLSETNATDEDGRSIVTVSAKSEAGMHTTQLSVATPLPATEPGSRTPNASQEGAATPPKTRKTKRQLWDEVTITSITRAFTLLYTLSLLTMLTRIQLNLLGRRSYLSSVVSLATGGGAAHGTISLENNDDDGGAEHAYGTDFDVNRKYLTFSWWLLNRGWVGVMQHVEAAVRRVFGHLSPRDTVTLETFARLTADVRARVEGRAAGGTAWLPFLLPQPHMEDFVLRESGVLDEADPAAASVSADAASASASPSPPSLTSAPPSSPTSAAASLRRLLDETADLIESPHFAHVHNQLLDAGFALLLENKLAPSVFDTPASASASAPPAALDTRPLGSSGGSSRAVLLPKILSVLTRQAHVIGNGMPNEYLQAMEGVPDLEGFAAVVYSSNWQAEIVPDEGIAGSQTLAAAGGGGDGAGGKDALGGHSQGGRRQQPPPPPDEAAGLSSGVLVDADAELEAQSSLFESAWEKASGRK